MSGRPVLTKWLTGAQAGHPLLRPEMPDWFLDTLELIAAPVDAAAPLRLPTKIKAFRTLTTDKALLEQRAELLIGSMLARGGVPFEFGKDHPDYVLGGQALGIEVGSRALDGPWALHDRLEELLGANGSDIFAQLSFDDRPLKLGAARIEEIAQQVASHPMSQPTDSIRFDDVGLSVRLTRGAVTTASRVAVTFAGGLGLELTAHMADVEREIENKAMEKARQADKMPTIVLLDMSRTGWAWMRGPEAMVPALQKILPSTPFAGLGAFTTSLTVTSRCRRTSRSPVPSSRMRQNWSSKSPALSTSPPTRAESDPQQLPVRHGLQAAAGNLGLTVFLAVPARRNRGSRQFGLSELLNSRETRFAAFYCEPGIEGAREGQRRGPGRLLPPNYLVPVPGGAERAVAAAEQAEDSQRIGAWIRTTGQTSPPRCRCWSRCRTSRSRPGCC